MVGDSENFKVLFAKNKDRVAASYNCGGAFDKVVGGIVVDVVRETVSGGCLSFGYDSHDKQPMIRFSDPNSYCEKSIPLLAYLEEWDEHYKNLLRPEIDGDPVGHRFIRFMMDGVKHFIREERAGRNPR